MVDFGVEIPEALGLDLVLQFRHFVRGLIRVIDGELVIAIENCLLRPDALHHVLAHALAGIELRLLLEVTHPRAFGRPCLAGEVSIDAGHDAQQRGLARAVDAEHTDLGVRIERQIDVLENLPIARIGLRETLHVINELTGHQYAPLALLGADRRRMWGGQR